MDTGDGRFITYTEPHELKELREKHRNSRGVFTVGEEIEIRGSRFKVKDIGPFEIKLKLLPAKPRIMEVKEGGE